MSALHKFGCGIVIAVVALVTPAPLLAQTNAPAVTAATPPEMSEADQFFTQYTRAAALAAKGATQQATLVMDQLYKNLSTSPWLEIALLKHSELSESQSAQAAVEGYDLLQKRVANAPYFIGTARRAQLFRAALNGAIDRGISRIRLQRVRDGLERYFIRYHQYPESLAKLSIFNYVDLADISDPNSRPFRYLPTGQQLRPTISYMRYELETIGVEPFLVQAPKLDGTTQINHDPEQYVALVRVPGRQEAVRVTEDQTLEGYYMAAIALRGVVLCSNNRILVLLTPQ